MSLWIIINIIAIQHMACSLIKTKEFIVKGKTTETERKTDRETEGKRMRQSEREVERALNREKGTEKQRQM